MLDATPVMGWVGWGGDKFLHMERKIASVVHSHPPSTYAHTRLDDYIPVAMFTIDPPVMFTIYPPYAEKNRAFASMQYMLGNFNACVRRVWDGPIVFRASPTPSLRLPFCGMSPLTSRSVTRVL